MKFRDPYKVQTITAPNEIYLAFFKVTENRYLPKKFNVTEIRDKG